jgi:hypothetical protein
VPRVRVRTPTTWSRLATLIDTVASVVVPEDENRFLALASKHRLDAELLLKIVAAVMEAQAGRPTAPSVDSSTGRSATGVNSKVLSSSEAPSGPKTWRDTPFGQRELAAHPELYADITTVGDAGRALSVAG